MFYPITMYENPCFVRAKETVSQNLRLIEKNNDDQFKG